MLIHLLPHLGDLRHAFGIWGARIRDVIPGPGLEQNQSTPTGKNLGVIQTMFLPTELTNLGGARKAPPLGCKISKVSKSRAVF